MNSDPSPSPSPSPSLSSHPDCPTLHSHSYLYPSPTSSNVYTHTHIQCLCKTNDIDRETHHGQQLSPSSLSPSSLSPFPSPLLFSTLHPFDHQVGGHQTDPYGQLLVYPLQSELSISPSLSSSPSFSFSSLSSSLLKPSSASRKALCERDFYHYSQHPKELLSFIPTFYGMIQVVDDQGINTKKAENEEKSFALPTSLPSPRLLSYLRLENLTYNFLCPCVMDIKIGTQTYDEEASTLKSHGDIAKYPYQSLLAMRIIGMKIFKWKTKQWEWKEKTFGKKLKPQEFQKGMEQFFPMMENQKNDKEGRGIVDDMESEIRKRIISHFISSINEIKQWFEVQNDYRFYSSSLLLVYEGNMDSYLAPSSSSSSSSSPFSPSLLNDISPFCRVKMVDFTHVYGPSRSKFFSLHNDALNVSGKHLQGNIRDEGYVKGLENLIQCLQMCLEGREWEWERETKNKEK